MTYRNRRSFVTAVAATGTLGLAGCLSDASEWYGDDENDDDSTPSEGDDDSSPSDPSDPSDDGDDSSELGHLPGDSIDDFESLDEWVTMLDAGALEAASDDPYAGSQSAHLTADEGTSYAGIYRTFPGGTDLSDSNFSVAVKFAEQEQLQLTLEVYAPNSRNTLTMRRTLTGPADSWVRVDFGVTSIDTQPDLSDVREVRLIARRRGSDEGPIDCQLDDLRAVERPERGRVMFLFDGTLESHYTHAFEHMNESGFGGVEAVIPEAVGEDGRLTIDRLDDMSEAGWDMAARPRTGARNIHEFTPEEQEGMIRRTRAYLENRGFEDGADHFITPRNLLGPETMELVREYHEQAFRYGGGPNGLPLTDPHNLGVFSGAADEETKQYVDYAADYGQLAVLHFEEIGEDGLSEDAFVDLLEYVEESDVDVVTATELLEGK
ncbi:polysaccharide deacetylase family protein [Natrialbaceae archaeon A-CW1-1]